MHVTAFATLKQTRLGNTESSQPKGSLSGVLISTSVNGVFVFGNRGQLQRGKPRAGECDRINLVRNLKSKGNLQRSVNVMHSSYNMGTASPITSTIREGFHEAVANRHMPHRPVLQAVQPCLWTEAE
jgi:hypothetical protein